MKKVFAAVILIVFLLAIYLNRGYARLYENNYDDMSLFTSSPITLNNKNFQTKVKYVAIGDSLTSGVGSKSIDKTLPYSVAQKIEQKMSTVLINFAIPGATSQDIINYQLNSAIEEAPNYLTFLVGVNDIRVFLPKERYEQNVDFILDQLSQKTSAKIIVFNIPNLGTKELVYPPYDTIFDIQTREFNEVLTRICKSRNLTLIDIYNPTKNTFSKIPGFYSPDQFHPSGDGYLMWGSLVKDQDL